MQLIKQYLCLEFSQINFLRPISNIKFFLIRNINLNDFWINQSNNIWSISEINLYAISRISFNVSYHFYVQLLKYFRQHLTQTFRQIRKAQNLNTIQMNTIINTITKKTLKTFMKKIMKATRDEKKHKISSNMINQKKCHNEKNYEKFNLINLIKLNGCNLLWKKRTVSIFFEVFLVFVY